MNRLPAPACCSPRAVLVTVLMTVVMLSGIGCGSGQPYATLADANAAYQRGDYPQAYAFAAAISNNGPSLDGFEAAYIAGLSASQLEQYGKAVRYLKRATGAFDKQLASDAQVMLGLAYVQQGKDALAAETLIAAAPRQQGEAKAKAWFHAADAQQRLGRWATARDYLLLARGASKDPSLLAAVNERLAVNGFTLEIGSYRDYANAEAAVATYGPRAREIGIGTAWIIDDPARAGQVRVHVGEFSTFASAASYRDELGVPEAFVVPVTGR